MSRVNSRAGSRVGSRVGSRANSPVGAQPPGDPTRETVALVPEGPELQAAVSLCSDGWYLFVTKEAIPADNKFTKEWIPGWWLAHVPPKNLQHDDVRTYATHHRGVQVFKKDVGKTEVEVSSIMMWTPLRCINTKGASSTTGGGIKKTQSSSSTLNKSDEDSHGTLVKDFTWFAMSSEDMKKADQFEAEKKKAEAEEEAKERQRQEEEQQKKLAEEKKKANGKKGSKKKGPVAEEDVQDIPAGRPSSFHLVDVGEVLEKPPSDAKFLLERWKIGRRCIVSFSARSKKGGELFLKCTPIVFGRAGPRGATTVDDKQIWAPHLKQPTLSALSTKSWRCVVLDPKYVKEMSMFGENSESASEMIYHVDDDAFDSADLALNEEAETRPSVRLSLVLNDDDPAEGVGRKSAGYAVTGRRSYTKVAKKIDELNNFMENNYGVCFSEEEESDVSSEDEEEEDDDESEEDSEDYSDSESDAAPRKKNKKTGQKKKKTTTTKPPVKKTNVKKSAVATEKPATSTKAPPTKRRRLENDDTASIASAATAATATSTRAGGKRGSKKNPKISSSNLVSVGHSTWAPALPEAEGAEGTSTFPSRIAFGEHKHNMDKKPMKTYSRKVTIKGKERIEYLTVPEDYDLSAIPTPATSPSISPQKKKKPRKANGGKKQKHKEEEEKEAEEMELDGEMESFLLDLQANVNNTKE